MIDVVFKSELSPMRRLLSGKNRVVASLAIAALALAACAKPEPKIAFDRASVPQVRMVGFLTPRFPDAARMSYTYTPTAAPSALGIAIVGLIDLKMRSDRNDTLEHALASQGYNAQSEFVSELTDTLRAAGYNVLPVSTTRESDGFVSAYPRTDSQKPDALLDVIVTGYGFHILQSGYSGRCSPYFEVRTRLVNPQTSAVLMQDHIAYGLPEVPAGTINAAVGSETPTLTHCFDELDAKPDVAVSMLRTASRASARALTNLLH